MLDYKKHHLVKKNSNILGGKNKYITISLFRALVFGKFIYMYLI